MHMLSKKKILYIAKFVNIGKKKKNIFFMLVQKQFSKAKFDPKTYKKTKFS